MAWNTLSVTLWPPAWKAKIVPMDSGLTWSGKPLLLIDYERETDGRPLLVDEVVEWFVGRGANLSSTTPQLVRLEDGDVSILVGKHLDSEVISITCRFRLTRKSYSDLQRWLD